MTAFGHLCIILALASICTNGLLPGHYGSFKRFSLCDRTINIPKHIYCGRNDVNNADSPDQNNVNPSLGLGPVDGTVSVAAVSTVMPAGFMKTLQWWIPVLVLVVQNSGLILTMRYSRVKSASATRYLACTAVLCAEVLKLIISGLASFEVDGERSLRKYGGVLKEQMWDRRVDMLPLCVPALLYMVSLVLSSRILPLLLSTTPQLRRAYPN